MLTERTDRAWFSQLLRTGQYGAINGRRGRHTSVVSSPPVLTKSLSNMRSYRRMLLREYSLLLRNSSNELKPCVGVDGTFCSSQHTSLLVDITCHQTRDRQREFIYQMNSQQQALQMNTMAGCQTRHQPINAGRPNIISNKQLKQKLQKLKMREKK